jgi:hypothetical protein
MEIEYKTGALEDIEFWKRSGNRKIIHSESFIFDERILK